MKKIVAFARVILIAAHSAHAFYLPEMAPKSFGEGET